MTDKIKLTNLGDSIEAEKSCLHTRQVFPSATKKINGKNYFKFKMGILSDAEITEELNPKLPFYKSTSKLDLGACVAGQSIEIYTLSVLKFKKINYTGTHSAYEAFPNKQTVAEIFLPFKFILDKALVKK